ncbi:DUF6708 domain-containing protein [Enterobacter asburiae]
MPLLSFDEPQSKLKPPVSCWREDMPENHEPQLVPPQLRWLETRNDTCLEVPRYSTEIIWRGMLFTAILMCALIFFIIWFSFLFGDYIFFIIGFVASFVPFILLLLSLKMYFVTPRNQPIRLNRKRQKIYIFDYNRSRLPCLNWTFSNIVYKLYLIQISDTTISWMK